MIYYVIKNTSDVTQAQLNASSARKEECTRKTKSGGKCILKFDESQSQYFMNDMWLTQDEAREALLETEWDMDAPGLIDRALAFMGFGGSNDATEP
jgi:hypothetical protein